MNKKVIVINGVGTCGKDTFVEFFKKYSKSNVRLISTVDDVKMILKEMGWDGKTKDVKTRKALHDIKMVWTEYNNGVFNGIKEAINEHSLKRETIFFVMCREPEEIRKFKDYYRSSCTTLLVKRDSAVVKGNYADESVYDYAYDVIIDNNGTLSQLEDSAKLFIEELKKSDEAFDRDLQQKLFLNDL